MSGSLVSTRTVLLSSNAGYQDALFREDKGSILRDMAAGGACSSYREQRTKGTTVKIWDRNDKRLERMEEKEDNCFVGKGEGKRVFSCRSVPGTDNPPLWMAEDNNVHLLSTMAKK